VRVIDCDCGHTILAATDEELFAVVREHLHTEHPEMGLGDEELRRLVREQAYDATDS
jgi:predicted small metal-binding protein